ncbi:hypothetical protein [Persicobacter psychrovividus]|uniref:Uncharacterized protein n=1 Tax=Persicobacter psychrovividus TaxID=387638 RepID=A0ABN6LDB4_9BACT|nr:hypothetical protein PEPS_15870 [Persicobacter psychrovividus]
MIINTILPEECLIQELNGNIKTFRKTIFFLEQYKRLGLFNAFRKEIAVGEVSIKVEEEGSTRIEHRVNNRKKSTDTRVRVDMGENHSFIKKTFSQQDELLAQEEVIRTDDQLIEKIIITDYKEGETTLITFQYNEQKLIERIEFSNEHGSVFQTASFRYDKKGRLIEEKGSRHRRKISFEEFHYITQFKYLKKDKQGNWLQRRLKTEYGFHYQNVTKYALEERELTYQ